MPLSGLSRLDRLIVIIGGHLVNEVRTEKRRSARPAVGEQQTIGYSNSVSPAKELEAQIRITVEDDVWPETSDLAYDERKAAQLFHYVGVPPDEWSKHLGQPAGPRETGSHALQWGLFARPLDHIRIEARRRLQTVESFTKERLNSSVVNSHACAAKQDALGVGHSETTKKGAGIDWLAHRRTAYGLDIKVCMKHSKISVIVNAGVVASIATTYVQAATRLRPNPNTMPVVGW
jgi:hypothetical protein